MDSRRVLVGTLGTKGAGIRKQKHISNPDVAGKRLILMCELRAVRFLADVVETDARPTYTHTHIHTYTHTHSFIRSRQPLPVHPAW